MKCEECKSKRIVAYEYRGAYDGWLIYKCKDCKKVFHRIGGELKNKYILEEYGPIVFNTEKGWYKNLSLINNNNV